VSSLPRHLCNWAHKSEVSFCAFMTGCDVVQSSVDRDVVMTEARMLVVLHTLVAHIGAVLVALSKALLRRRQRCSTQPDKRWQRMARLHRPQRCRGHSRAGTGSTLQLCWWHMVLPPTWPRHWWLPHRRRCCAAQPCRSRQLRPQLQPHGSGPGGGRTGTAVALRSHAGRGTSDRSCMHEAAMQVAAAQAPSVRSAAVPVAAAQATAACTWQRCRWQPHRRRRCAAQPCQSRQLRPQLHARGSDDARGSDAGGSHTGAVGAQRSRASRCSSDHSCMHEAVMLMAVAQAPVIWSAAASVATAHAAATFTAT
jgi:hypothetical protein